MAASDTISQSEKLEYREALWGELYYGTKAQLQNIGIAVGLAFPDERGGPKRSLCTRDSRGFEATVTRAYDGRRYAASINLPGRERPSEQWRDFAPGVRACSDHWWFDEYIGTADALAASGLVRTDQLPGQPDMNRVQVTILADGTVLGRKRKRGREPGTKTITRASKATYAVRVLISQDEQERRSKARGRAEKEYEARMRALSRPNPLIGVNSHPRRITSLAIEEYRETVKDAAALFFEVMEGYMFNPGETCALKNRENGGPMYSPEVREALLGHQNSIWQELNRLIDEGPVISKNSGTRPALRLVSRGKSASDN